MHYKVPEFMGSIKANSGWTVSFHYKKNVGASTMSTRECVDFFYTLDDWKDNCSLGFEQLHDGINWTKNEARQIIADRLGRDESQGWPDRNLQERRRQNHNRRLATRS